MKCLITCLEVISPTLLPFITEGIISYKPQGVIKQLGYDQPVIQVAGEMGYSNKLIDEAQFVGEVRLHIVAKFQSIFWLDKAKVGVRSFGCSIYCKKNLSTMSDLVLN